MAKYHDSPLLLRNPVIVAKSVNSSIRDVAGSSIKWYELQTVVKLVCFADTVPVGV